MECVWTPELNIVIYEEPGPDDDTIVKESQSVVARNGVMVDEPNGVSPQLAYLVLLSSDFQRLWEGLERGDTSGTSVAVLRQFSPETDRYIDDRDGYVFGWIGDDEDDNGRILLLQIMRSEVRESSELRPPLCDRR